VADMHVDDLTGAVFAHGEDLVGDGDDTNGGDDAADPVSPLRSSSSMERSRGRAPTAGEGRAWKRWAGVASFKLRWGRSWL
jgi:hypothetical protein